MAESFARVGEIEICYETFGDPSDPAMLLIMGLGTQMVAWHDDFCAQLAGRGFFVIRHDNRDIGRSTHLDGAPVPDAACSSPSATARSRLHARRHGGRQRRRARPPRHRAGPHRRRLDGRDDRPDDRDPLPASARCRWSRSCPTPASFWNGQPALTMYAVLLKPVAARARGASSSTRSTCSPRSAAPASRPRSRTCATIATLSYDRGHDARGSQRQLRGDRRRPRPLARAAQADASPRP